MKRSSRRRLRVLSGALITASALAGAVPEVVHAAPATGTVQPVPEEWEVPAADAVEGAGEEGFWEGYGPGGSAAGGVGVGDGGALSVTDALGGVAAWLPVSETEAETEAEEVRTEAEPAVSEGESADERAGAGTPAGRPGAGAAGPELPEAGPAAGLPTVERPAAGLPAVEAPGSQPPEPAAPAAELPDAEAPEAAEPDDAPAAEASEAGVSDAEVPAPSAPDATAAPAPQAAEPAPDGGINEDGDGFEPPGRRTPASAYDYAAETGGEQLSRTGADFWLPLGSGLGSLAALGAGAVVVARKRRNA